MRSISTLLALSILCAAGGLSSASQGPDGGVQVRWVEDAGGKGNLRVEVSGLKETASGPRDEAAWRAVLSAYAGADPDKDGTPPMAAKYRVESGVLVLEPQFPPAPGATYTAIMRVDGSPPQVVRFTARERPAAPPTHVTRVYPTADRVPENLLKFYVHFSAPMSRGHVYDHIRLLDSAGKEIELPFLELDEELWDPEMTRLTLFIDPGRIKRGVRPLEEVGPALESGKRFTLSIDRGWPDARGKPLKEEFRKPFEVGPPDRDPLVPHRWEIRVPKAASREPLVVGFGEPMDHALARRLIRVLDNSGNPVAGAVEMEVWERRWAFTPDLPWGRGDYSLVVQPTLEDLAGNNIGKPFEVDLVEGTEPAVLRPVSLQVKVR